MNNKYILFYSDRCPHSREFILKLSKINLLDKFIKINVLKNINNISKVYYTLNDGNYGCEKIKDMTSTHISNGFRAIFNKYLK